jgi:thiamine-monophosphate kinase
MTTESDLIASLRRFATDPAARGLLDDAAVVEVGGERLVFTHDMLVEGVHFLPADPPEDVAWKLLAVNLSDLAGKGARPLAVLLGYSLAGAGEWDERFTEGLGRALRAFDIALLGGDTVSVPAGAPRSLGMTAIGTADSVVPSRSGAASGDILWLTGTIGDAGAGLAIARGREGPATLLERYRSPMPRLEAGQRLAPLVTAMMDVSDGLLLDARRMAQASQVVAVIELDRLPLSDAYLDFAGEDREARLAAATAGDDYELLFTASHERAAEILSLSDAIGLPISRIGAIQAGSGLSLTDAGQDVPLPGRLGFEHGR